MDTKEISNEFDIIYNNITSNAAPGLDEYEKSVFLTRIQEEMVLDLYNGHSQEYGSFETSEEVRKYLSTLVKSGEVTLVNYDPPNVDNTINQYWGNINYTLYNYVINLNTEGFTDIINIIYEAAVFDEDEYPATWVDTVDTRDVEIKSLKHMDYHSTMRNPFKRPAKNRIFRVDSNIVDVTGDTNIVELITACKLFSYRFRYIKRPQPIVLEDLSPYGITINGIDSVTECELPHALHIKIIEKAAQAAAKVYKDSH